ncbi:MAG TPA: UTP--glucose-1-phosphate uridylyltransferase GalU [Methylomusa anaerophila]|uniref:UTP--glucose-1-phosphate uridylyltransferase n=1 Tax=Methylomusa anaerophila TaxID=1930071 RepID=A0A348AGB2_9FIRM|nr:UTP--glucose-1-phosphate uridylyltransferase GalU [Methylomusa anaerophila]BBB90110.1 UTP--glucose-1-phosphate uridylyltransferase [Methylomusa anaerophila]HML88166.1 UTP--glucose-1-phosphate uridylyltransferase GalU [Methylomusa anaerophila]
MSIKQTVIRKAIIPAAGLGTRFLPATKAQPKEMLPIVDKPAIQYIIEEAIQSGIKDILIITGRNKRAIEDHFDRAVELEVTLKEQGKYDLLGLVQELSRVTIHYVRQKEAKGLGHAVLCAKQFVGNEPFAVLLGDDIVDAQVPCLKQLMNVYNDCQGSILGVQEVPAANVSKYGIIKPVPVKENVWQAVDMVEKPAMEAAPSRLAVLGRYIIEPEIFALLEETPPGSGGEIQLTDALKRLASLKPVYAYNFEGRRYDVGDKQGYLEATMEFALKRPDLREKFLNYLVKKVGPVISKEIAATASVAEK